MSSATIRRCPPATALALLALVLAGCHRTPSTAQEVLDRSIAAHGGPALTNWQSLEIRGRIEMQDGITYKASYLLLAKADGRLRIEHDMTRDRGRLFYEYFMNGGATWSRANLVVGSPNVKQLKRWFEQCFGVARLGRGGARPSVTLKPDTVVEWRERKAGSNEWRSTDPRPAYVLAYTSDGEAVELHVDKESFYLVQETWPGGRRIYRDFKRFGDAIVPTRILEITKGRQGDVVTPISYESVAFNQPIEDWLFTEDKPARAPGADRAGGTIQQ